MSRVPRPGPAAFPPDGPFETEAHARSVPAVHAARPGTGGRQQVNHRMLCEAVTEAGIEIGAYDHRVIAWLAGWEPQTVAVIAGLITRAARRRMSVSVAALAAGPALPGTQRAVIAAALEDAVSRRATRIRSALSCRTCGRSAEHCDAHAADLAAIVAYRALARTLGVAVPL